MILLVSKKKILVNRINLSLHWFLKLLCGVFFKSYIWIQYLIRTSNPLYCKPYPTPIRIVVWSKYYWFWIYFMLIKILFWFLIFFLKITFFQIFYTCICLSVGVFFFKTPNEFIVLLLIPDIGEPILIFATFVGRLQINLVN